MTAHMRTVAEVFGVRIKVFNNGTDRPHFLAFYENFMGQFDLETLEMTNGDLPSATITVVREWVADHIEELWEAWDL
ncbi:MAG TPA: DUF4160 domain-containing protein [bacterium]|nr:DUF4160 domain-containing protein [bacterium]